MQTLSQNSSKAALTEDWRNAGFGIYIHWPYCEAKCPYCDFNSHVARVIEQDRWKQAYLAEIDRAAEAYPGRVLNTVFFGGGTPSLMDSDVVAAVLERIRQSWTTANDFEVTLEANPGSVEAGRFKGFHDAGVNRISIGVQALNDTDLQRLGRIHTAKEARQAFDVARNLFSRVSFDLIYARQDQSLADWKAELAQALDMAVDHLSLYQLTIEPGTPFAHQLSNGDLPGLPTDDVSADMYDVTREVCDQYGMSAYEVSNHAQSGSESRHNLIYWRYGDYVGIGPGAHGRVTKSGRKYATEAMSHPDRWLSGAEQGQALRSSIELSHETQADEYLMMSLRLSEGTDRLRYTALAGRDLPEDVLSHLSDIGMLDISVDRIKATQQGRVVLNAVIRELITG